MKRGKNIEVSSGIQAAKQTKNNFPNTVEMCMK